MQPVKLYDTFIKKTYWCLEFAPNCIGGCGVGGMIRLSTLTETESKKVGQNRCPQSITLLTSRYEEVKTGALRVSLYT